MSSTKKPMGTTLYALLGLLSIKDWTTYELAAQMDRGLSKFWPRARSNVFEGPKKLVALGLATAKKERVGKRSRTVYSITPAGRRALARWLPTPGEPPVLEWEQLVKVFFAENGTKAGLLATLTSMREWSEEQRKHHRDRARSYLDGEGPFPERMPIHGLVGSFLGDFADLVGAWAARSAAIVDEWPEDIRTAAPDWATFERFATTDGRSPSA